MRLAKELAKNLLFAITEKEHALGVSHTCKCIFLSPHFSLITSCLWGKFSKLHWKENHCLFILPVGNSFHLFTDMCGRLNKMIPN